MLFHWTTGLIRISSVFALMLFFWSRLPCCMSHLSLLWSVTVPQSSLISHNPHTFAKNCLIICKVSLSVVCIQCVSSWLDRNSVPVSFSVRCVWDTCCQYFLSLVVLTLITWSRLITIWRWFTRESSKKDEDIETKGHQQKACHLNS